MRLGSLTVCVSRECPSTECALELQRRDTLSPQEQGRLAIEESHDTIGIVPHLTHCLAQLAKQNANQREVPKYISVRVERRGGLGHRGHRGSRGRVPRHLLERGPHQASRLEQASHGAPMPVGRGAAVPLASLVAVQVASVVAVSLASVVARGPTRTGMTLGVCTEQQW